MPDSYMSLFPYTQNSLEAIKLSSRVGFAVTQMAANYWKLAFGLAENVNKTYFLNLRTFSKPLWSVNSQIPEKFADIQENTAKALLTFWRQGAIQTHEKLSQERQVKVDFLNLFTEMPPSQDWTFEYDNAKVLVDLPGLRLIDISEKQSHEIGNYTVVFAPRAGHHSNIAERVALFMRDNGLSRMAIVEQKCAEDIPLYIDGQRHYENFNGQVRQYRQVLEYLKDLSGFASHLVAICQPGPLLMATLMMHPELGKTFGSAGSPMHTEGERGYLTDFSRLVGEAFIDKIINLTSRTINSKHDGAGRQVYDGRFHVSGFYFLGIDSHARNFLKLFSDLKNGNETAAQRQKVFYDWYNTVNHSAVGFIKDTYKQIFVKNALIRGTLEIEGRKLSIGNYPKSVPLWAMGGTNDEITPPKQATGHMPLIRSVPQKDKLTIICEAGHMGLFRSQKILDTHYRNVVDFILTHSDHMA